MSTRSIVFAVAVLAGGLFLSSAWAVEGTTTADARMRIGPGIEFAEIGMIEAGSALTIHSCNDGQAWCLVRINGRSGWVPGVLVNFGGISKAEIYYDPDIPVSLQLTGREFPGEGLSDRHLLRDFRFIERSHFSDKQLPRDFRFIERSRFSDKRLPRDFRSERSRLSDKQLPRDFRSTIHSPGFRLHKQGFPAVTGDQLPGRLIGRRGSRQVPARP